MRSVNWHTLGTIGGPIQHPEAFQISNMLEVDYDLYLFDVGNGVLRQMAKLGKSPAKLKAVFVTHHHPDHIADLVLVVLSRRQGRSKEKLQIFGPRGTKQIVEGSCRALAPVIWADRDPNAHDLSLLDLVEVHDIEIGTSEMPVVYEDESVTVESLLVSHFKPAAPDDPKGANAVGYRITAKGRVLAYTGDTGPAENLVRLAENADLFVTEVCDFDRIVASFDQHRGMSDEVRKQVTFNMANNHISPEEIAKVVSIAKPNQVLLTHFVPGPPKDEHLIQTTYIDPIKKLSPETVVIMANDLGSY